MAEEIEETNAGLRKKGSIEEVAEFAQQVREGLENEVDQESIEEFETWRPREEDTDEDIKKRTVETASLKKKKVEKDSGGSKDFSEAGRKTLEAGKNALKPSEAGKDLKEASQKFSRPFRSGSRKAARGMEEEVYSSLMTKFNPYFFDAKEFSVDLRSRKDGKYTMEINVPDKDRRSSMKQHLKEEDN
ncbi:MAG: DUF5828 family protein [Candidatus Nanohaloarchaea archaeon]